MNKTAKIFIAVFVAFVLASSGFIGGFVAGSVKNDMLKQFNGNPLSSSETSTTQELSRRVTEVSSMMDKDALVPSTIESATVGAIDGLLSSTGDKWAEYFPPVEAKSNEEMMSGEFSGIGVVLNEKNGQVSVGEVYAGSPAQKSGVLENDRIVEIDGKRQDTWTAEQVSKLVRGPKGTSVTIVFFRPDSATSKEGKEVKLMMVRDTITIKNVTTEVFDGVGYIAMGTFNSHSTEDVANAIKELDKKNVSGYVIDLRYNGGGLLNQAVGIGSLFIDKNVMVQVETRDKKREKEMTTAAKITDKPLVFLVNGHSASASEVLVGAMKDYKRATIVGEKTYGKGSVQQMQEVSFGGSVKFTIAHWLTPNGSLIDKVGITPDIVVAPSPADEKKDMDDYKNDAQLLKAVETVKDIAK